MTTFVLVSGAWHAGWCWERIVPLLEAAGHRAIAPDLLGMGSDTTPLSEVTLARWADQIADIVRSLDEKIVLVGHSRGGIVISEVAERVPERIATLVYLAAFIVPSGQTLLECGAQMPRESQESIIAGRGDGTTVVLPEAAGPNFYNGTAPEWVDRARSHLGPEPMVVFSTPLHLTDAAFGSVPRAYIECTLDKAVPLPLQRMMQSALPCAPVVTLETDHSPFYSAPALLADALVRIATAAGA